MRIVGLLLFITLGFQATAQYFAKDLPSIGNNFQFTNPAAVTDDHQLKSSMYVDSRFHSSSLYGSFLYTGDFWINDKTNVGALGLFSSEFNQRQMRFGLSFTRILALGDVKLKVGVRPTYIKRDFRDDFISTHPHNLSDYENRLHLTLGSAMKYKNWEVGASFGPYTSLGNLITLNNTNNIVHSTSVNTYTQYKWQWHSSWSTTPFASFVATLNEDPINIQNYSLGTQIGFKDRAHGWVGLRIIHPKIPEEVHLSNQLQMGLRAEVYQGITIHYRYSTYLESLVPAPFTTHLFGLSFEMDGEG